MSDIFKFEFNGVIELKESCLTANGLVTNDWRFTNVAHIELPTTYSLSLKEINFGALKLTSSEDTVIEAEPARMSVIKLSDHREKEAFISKEEFRGNTTTTEEI